MKVRFLGFNIEITSKFSLNECISQIPKLEGLSEGTDENETSGRLLFIDNSSNPNYHLGLIVTVKNQRTYCELKEDNATLKMIVSKLEDNAKLMDFNFFIINKKNGIGLYQHYHQSCSLNQAMRLLKTKYYAIKDEEKEAHKQKLLDEGKSENQSSKKAGAEDKGYFKWSQLVRAEKLKDLIDELSTINALEFDLLHLAPDNKDFSQLSQYVKKERKRITFTPNTFASNISGIISSGINSLAPKQGRIYGQNSDGIDKVIDIQNTADIFSEYEYDDVADHIHNLSISDFQSSWFITELLDVCNTKNHIFEAETQ